MKYFYINFIAFTFLGISFLFSQEFELKLIISDSQNKKPLESVSVLINTLSGGGITNLEGVFKKSLPAKQYKVSLEYLGYSNKQFIVNLNKNITLEIEMEILRQ